MINVTPIAKGLLAHNAKSALEYASQPQDAQEAVFKFLLKRGRDTKWGQEHDFDKVRTYEEYRRVVPVQDYENFRPYAMRMINGEADVLWPGKCARFAQSSGTSGGKSKYIPITNESLRLNHYAGAAASVGMYLRAYPDSRMFAGKGFILGGSFANELSLTANVRVGDLSANLIDNVNPVVEFYRVPNKKIALMEKWQEKLPAIIDAAIHENITNLSGVPSWFLTVLKGALQKTGARTINEIWPNMEVFFHGGISFSPYRQEYNKITNSDMRYWENYNASEGFFAAQAFPETPGMVPMLKHGVFYELIPLNQVGQAFPDAIPIWEAKPGRTYALVLSSCNGMWRYVVGDTVKIQSIDPLTFTIAGRTTSYINAFGEEVMAHNADAALSRACHDMHCSILNYTVAPVYTHDATKGRHQWLIEWGENPANLDEFTKKLDLYLQQENSDYQAKRQDNIFLDCLEVISATTGTFDRWMYSTGRMGGQRKVPRLCNDRMIMDSLIENFLNP